MHKVNCPKCRRILFTYEDDIEKGKLVININCPDCKSMTIVDFDTEAKQNNKEYLGKMNFDDNKFLK